VTNVAKSKYKVSRRLMTSIWGDAKDPVHRKNYRPGQHGATTRVRASSYGLHLKAKQTIKAHYGRIKEHQLKAVFTLAKKMKGNTADNFISLLERRLDMVVYRLNLAPTIFAARQLVSHKHVMVNKKIVNIASFRVKNGDTVSLTDKTHALTLVSDSLTNMIRKVPDYMKLDIHTKTGCFIHDPASISDVPFPFDTQMQLVVEHYSR